MGDTALDDGFRSHSARPGAERMDMSRLDELRSTLAAPGREVTPAAMG